MAKEKKDIQALINDPRKGAILENGKPIDDRTAAKIHDDGDSGPKTTPHLRELGFEGKRFPNPEALAEAVKELYREAKQRKKKQKKALEDYLNSPTCDLFTPAANQAKEDKPLTRRELNDLWRNEKSGPGTAALLNELKKDNKKQNSIPELLNNAKALSQKKRKQLKDQLNDAKCPVFSEVKNKEAVKPNEEAVNRLAEESEAGPATGPIVKDLGDIGRKFGDSDEMIPAVKKFAKNNLGPLGVALTQAEEQADDREALMEYLSDPNTVLLDEVKDIHDPDVEALLDEGQGLENTKDLLDYLNDDGNRFHDIPKINRCIRQSTS